MLHLRRPRLRTLLVGLAVASGLALSPSARAQSPVAPDCRGEDLLPRLAVEDAEAARRVDEAASRIPNGNAMLWRITRAGTQPSYLFGTIHLSDDRVVNLSPTVRKAIAGSRVVALEIADVSAEAVGAALAKLRGRLVFEDGRRLTDMLEPDEIAIARDGFARSGFPAETFPAFRPWFVATMLSMTECERRRIAAGRVYLDAHVGNLGKAAGARLASLETIESQFLAMASISEPDQLTMLRSTIKSIEHTQNFFETILRRYLDREVSKVLPFQQELVRRAGIDPKAFDGFYKAMLTVRNPRMRDAALPLLKKGRAFIAVGALHLIGDDGLVALFQSAGYDVTPVE
jgi:uncharacterized protein YbaP (TraB family)